MLFGTPINPTFTILHTSIPAMPNLSDCGVALNKLPVKEVPQKMY